MSQKRGTNEVNFRNSGATIPAYRVIKPSGNNTVALWDTATAIMIGLSQEQCDSLGAIQVAIGGTAKGQAGASVSAGALLTGLTATGEVIECLAGSLLATTTTAIPRTIGVALQTGDTGAAIEVLIMPGPLRIAFA